jgi:putative transposase
MLYSPPGHHKRYTTEQKIRVPREAERTDKTILDVCRQQQISEQTFYRWKKEFGMMEVDQAKQLKALQKENARLKRMPSMKRVRFMHE